MIDQEWETAPTVYRVVVDRDPLPIVGVKARGIGGVIRRRITRRRASHLMALAFPTRGVDSLADPSVTRVIAQDREEDAILHLLLWNGFV